MTAWLPVRVMVWPSAAASALTVRLAGVAEVPRATVKEASPVVTEKAPVPMKVLARVTVFSAPVTEMAPEASPAMVSVPAVPPAASASIVSAAVPLAVRVVAPVPISNVAAVALVTVAVMAPA